MVIKQQFKKAYSVLQQAWLKSQADLDYQPECYYWDKNPYGGAPCVSYNSSGECTEWKLADGSPLPSDYNGRFGECSVFKEQILKNLTIIKTCENNALANGCIPEYEGNDTALKASDDSLTDKDITKATSGCAGYRKSNIARQRTVYVLSDGVILISYNLPQLFAVDVNGKKGPNKWGYDVFQFITKANINKPLSITAGGCDFIEKGGVTTSQMIINSVK